MNKNYSIQSGDRVVAKEVRIGIICSQFNYFIVEQLEQGAVQTCQRHGMTEQQLDIVHVPGAFELPLMAKKMAETGRYNGLIALGVVIRGATPHFDHVANAASSGLSQAALTTGIPIGFGLLTTDSLEQAIERAGTKAGNKGADCAITVIEMISLLRRLEV